MTDLKLNLIIIGTAILWSMRTFRMYNTPVDRELTEHYTDDYDISYDSWQVATFVTAVIFGLILVVLPFLYHENTTKIQNQLQSAPTIQKVTNNQFSDINAMAKALNWQGFTAGDLDTDKIKVKSKNEIILKADVPLTEWGETGATPGTFALPYGQTYVGADNYTVALQKQSNGSYKAKILGYTHDRDQTKVHHGVRNRHFSTVYPIFVLAASWTLTYFFSKRNKIDQYEDYNEFAED